MYVNILLSLKEVHRVQFLGELTLFDAAPTSCVKTRRVGLDHDVGPTGSVLSWEVFLFFFLPVQTIFWGKPIRSHSSYDLKPLSIDISNAFLSLFG
jgi:hypothetical protein